MEELLTQIRIGVNSRLYLKDPHSSELGCNIVRQGVELIDELGFENFTFRKLGQAIHSPEASIYRYFESKQQLLLYLSAWYWGWMEYRLMMSLSNVGPAEKRLEKALLLITEQEQDIQLPEMNLAKLTRIVHAESVKSYLNKEVDKVNRVGAFVNYKQFCARLAAIVTEINPDYKYPVMLISTVIEGAHLQYFFGEHLPGLTNKQKNNNYISRFYTDLVFKTIKP